MPTFVHTNVYGEKHRLTYATEEELLAFANKVREAGGGNPIGGFFPAEPGVANACLIAQALNFECEVQGYEKGLWIMEVHGRDEAQIDKIVRNIAKATGCRVLTWEGDEVLADDVDEEDRAYAVILPRRIGNTALAFDHAARGWISKYRKDGKRALEV